MNDVLLRNCMLKFFEEHFNLGRLKEDLEELQKNYEQYMMAYKATVLNQKSIQVQNESLFNEQVGNRRILSMYMLGILSPSHAADLINSNKHIFNDTVSFANYQTAVSAAALLEGWVKAYSGSPIITSTEPSWFLEHTELKLPKMKIPSTNERSSFYHGFIKYFDEKKIGITVENHHKQFLQISITVDSRYANSLSFWRGYLLDLAGKFFIKTDLFEYICTSSYPFFAQHYRIFRIMFYKKNAKKVMPILYQRIFSCRTDEIFINRKYIQDPVINWDHVISELKK
ncbi:hypothetical protein GC096_04060 [Paenibacillus sp. LMG 31461]|uniref:Uncharacterized protein n=1 Tax=Paenibacillus plantarum TaxID=2654975 RepID=A0ABX1X490_9BACL|nr:hypothetical protein [Paenibacillus plantarum]NOU63221.1 hypothetical protein [Paenibacillus plantarum]